jgi:hypothetical protein
MSSAKSASQSVDEARDRICHEFARMLNSGAWTVRIRIATMPEGNNEVWFYSHRANLWRKEPDRVTDPELVLAIEETVEMLATRERADEWTIRRHDSHDVHDFVVRFHRGKLEQRLGANLESALEGLLFRDGHDSKRDKRRAIRTPRRDETM